MPVMPELVGEGYLITQAIADFLSTHPVLQLDGICFRSVQSSEGAFDLSAQNVILFHKASKVLRSEHGRHIKTSFDLWEYEEGGAWYAPRITTYKSDQTVRDSGWPRTNDAQMTATLELDRDSIMIHQVKGIKVKTDEYSVDHSVAVVKNESINLDRDDFEKPSHILP
jgi:hypothetical protein